MGKYFAGLLLFIFGGLYFYYNQRSNVVVSPRDTIQKAVAKAKDTKRLSNEEEQMLKVQLAIIDYMTHATDRRPPQSLQELVPKYFDVLPKDPASKQPYQYERTDKGYKLALPGDTTFASKGVAQPRKTTGEGEVAGTTSQVLLDVVNPNTMAVDDFVYTAEGKRDPFKQFDLSSKVVAGGGSPLEQYDLSQLRLTAVISDPGKGAKAIVEDATGKGYTVKIGTKIGNRGGVIMAIEPNVMKVLEIETDFAGVEKQTVVEVKIQPQAGLDPDLKKKSKSKKDQPKRK